MQSFLVVVQILIGVSMIGVILVQHGKGADAGAAFGSGASSTVFGARGSATFLTKATALFAVLFLANSLLLGALSSGAPEPQSLMERGQQEEGGGPTGVIESTIEPLEEGEDSAPGMAPEESDLPDVPGMGAGAEDDSPPLLKGEEKMPSAPPEATGQGVGDAKPEGEAVDPPKAAPAPAAESASGPPQEAAEKLEPDTGTGSEGVREEGKEGAEPPEARDTGPAEEPSGKVQ